MYERLRVVIIVFCLAAVGVAIFERAIALIALAALLAVVGVVGITAWVIRGTNGEGGGPPSSDS